MSVSIRQRVQKNLRPMPQSPTDWSLVIYRWRYRRNTSVGKVQAHNFFFLARLSLSVRPSVFFFLTDLPTEMRITDDQYSDRRISSVRPSTNILSTNCVPHTNRIILLVKLLNRVVILYSKTQYFYF